MIAPQVLRAQGGQFAGSVGHGAARTTSGRTARGAAAAKRHAAAAANLSFNARTGRGTGYGLRGGDARVRALQRALNRLGLGGKGLAVDGQLGPLTTAAVSAAQSKLGVKPDGVVTPALLSRLVGMKAPTRPRRARQVMKKAAGQAPARARTTHSPGRAIL